MTFTADEQEQHFKNCYGCNPNDAFESAKRSFTYEGGGINAVVTSMLSDVQEMILLGDGDSARKHLNLAKFFLIKDADK